MSIELDDGPVRRAIELAIVKQMRVATFDRKDIAKHLSEMVTEALWEVAVLTETDGPERGILAGKRMIETWE